MIMMSRRRRQVNKAGVKKNNRTKKLHVTYEILTAASMKAAIF
jgi:hypothetical protein